ncbi:MAG: sulfotransferase domain-containing protein [Pseudomonadales bacterium]
MNNRPNFFILGAPRCGTSSLAYWLSTHPNIFMPPIKEPHYFSKDLANRTIRTMSRYESLFAEVEEHHMVVGEASTWYLYSREAVRNIEESCSGSLYIVMSRDPVEMAYSLYHHNVSVLYEDQSSFESAWRLQEDRAAGKKIPRSCVEPAFLQYRKACALGSMIERVFNLVPPERVFHVPLDAVVLNPSREYERVLQFLGVPSDQRDEFPVINEAQIYKSRVLQRWLKFGEKMRVRLGINRGIGLTGLNLTRRPRDEIPPAFADELNLVFEEERSRLLRISEWANH